MQESISSGREVNPTSLIIFECLLILMTREIIWLSDKTVTSAPKVQQSDLGHVGEDCIEEAEGATSDKTSPNLCNV